MTDTLTRQTLPSARAYPEQGLPDVLDGALDPEKVFDRTVGLDDVPAAYQAMDACTFVALAGFRRHEAKAVTSEIKG